MNILWGLRESSHIYANLGNFSDTAANVVS